MAGNYKGGLVDFLAAADSLVRFLALDPHFNIVTPGVLAACNEVRTLWGDDGPNLEDVLSKVESTLTRLATSS